MILFEAQQSKLPGFALATGNPVRVFCKFLSQNFDRNVAAELLVLFHKDFAHAAFAELGCNFVMS